MLSDNGKTVVDKKLLVGRDGLRRLRVAAIGRYASAALSAAAMTSKSI
jgi:hypothetical protein